MRANDQQGRDFAFQLDSGHRLSSNTLYHLLIIHNIAQLHPMRKTLIGFWLTHARANQ